jgi:serine/threonine protein kinase
LERVSTWLGQIASALELVHSAGLVHGNLKPSAIGFDQSDNAYLTDFSIAHRLHDGTGPSLVGAPAYMAPEQWEQGVLTRAVDQFGLAAIAYYMVAGAVPFEGQDNPTLRRRNFSRPPLDAHAEARHHGRDIPAGLSAVLRRALDVSPSSRYAGIVEFARDFADVLTKRPGDAMDVFLSYRREDSAFGATLIAKELSEKHGLKVFVDTAVTDGTGEFPMRIAKAIEGSKVFVCLLAKSTLASTWVRHEIELAHLHGVPTIPVFQESYKKPSKKKPLDPSIERLLRSEGVDVFDHHNVLFDYAIAKIARIVKDTIAARP